MPLYESIVCAVDFSEHSKRALRLSAQLARRANARLFVVHSIDLLLAEAAAAAYDVKQLETDAGAELQALIEGIAPGAVAAADIRTGRADQEILRYATERGADLIAMGTQGLGGVRKLLFGSVAQRVLRSVTVPVLAVSCREEAAAGDARIGAILAGVDLEERSRAIASHAASLAEALHVPLTLLHAIPHGPLAPYVVERNESAVAALRTRAEQQLEALALELAGRAPVTTEVRIGQPAEQIADLAATMTAALIVIGLGGGGLLHRPGSTAYRVLCLSDSPALAVPA